MTALDVGCGVGWFSIPMARMVGEQGRVIAVDFNSRCSTCCSGEHSRRVWPTSPTPSVRAGPAGDRSSGRLRTRLCHASRSAGLARLLGEIHGCLKADGRLLVAEPGIHVPRKTFANEVATAEDAGLRLVEEIPVRWCWAGLPRAEVDYFSSRRVSARWRSPRRARLLRPPELVFLLLLDLRRIDKAEAGHVGPAINRQPLLAHAEDCQRSR